MSGPNGPRCGASVRSKMRSASAMSAATGANASPAAFEPDREAVSESGTPPDTAGGTVAIAVPIARPSRISGACRNPESIRPRCRPSIATGSR